MSNNVFANLPMPALNGGGAAVDVSTMGAQKTIVISGTFPGRAVEVQISQVAGGASGYTPVRTFTDGETKLVIPVAARFMRAFVKNRVTGDSFSCNVDVGAPEARCEFGVVPIPGADGDGADLAAGTFGSFHTFSMVGDFNGARVIIEASEDGTAYAPVLTFTGPSQQSWSGVARFFRANLKGFATGFTATCTVASVDDPLIPAVPVGPGQSGCLVFAPGTANTGPVVFNDFAALYAQLVEYRTGAGGGCYEIEIDDATTTPAVIPAAAYDLTGVTFRGAGDGAAMNLADGASFTNWWLGGGFENLTVLNLNTTTTPMLTPPAGSNLVLRRTSFQTTTGVTVPFIQYTTTGTHTVWLHEGSSIGGAQTGRVIGSSTAPSKTIRVVQDESSDIVAGATAIVLAAGANIQNEVPSMVKVPVGIATLSTPSPVLQTAMSLRPNPYLGSPAIEPVTPLHGQWLRLNAAGAAAHITQPLPSINAAANNLRCPGVPMVVSNAPTGGTPGLGFVVIVTPAAGDTIMGGTSYAVQPGQAVMFVSNGVSDWTVVADDGVPQVLVSPKYDGADGQTALANDVARAFLLGYAWKDIPNGTTLPVSWRNVVAGVDIVWGEVAIGIGAFVAGANSSITPKGFANVAVTGLPTAATNFTTNVTISGTVIRRGAPLWGIIAANTTTTEPQPLSGPADVQGSGRVQSRSAVWRPSLNIDVASAFVVDLTRGVPKQSWSVP